VGAVVNTAKVPAGATVAIVGLGGVGLAAVIGAVAAGASRIVAVDLAADKRDFARKLGATDAYDAADANVVEAIRAATTGGVEFALEFAGSVRAMDLAYRITRRGGTTVTAGLPPPSATFALPQVNLVAEERTVKGSYIGTCVPSRDLPRYVALYRHGKIAGESAAHAPHAARADQRGIRAPARGQGDPPGRRLLTTIRNRSSWHASLQGI
jgi:alcohol dehydrogenase